MKAASVLGAGELGKACALALAVDGVATVRLLTRDTLLTASDSVENGSGAGKAGSPFSNEITPSSSTSLPSSAIRLCDVKKMLREKAVLQESIKHPLFICTPITAYLSPEDAWAKAAFGKEHSPITHAVLQAWRRATLAAEAPISMPSTLAYPLKTSHINIPFVCTFTRGFAANGGVPAELAEELLNGRDVSTIADRRDVPVLVAAGPLLAKEWAQQCTPVESNLKPGSSSSSISQRPRSALSAAVEESIEENAMKMGTENNTAARSTLSYPHAFSGASLTFAAWSPSTHKDTGKQEALAQQLNALFPRESVMYLREPDAAAVLSVVNGCVPLCAFGAGLVSSVYTGAGVNALASYAQHATVATEQLINELLGRPKGTPLPIAAWSTLHGACTSFASREFALGRQLDFYFRKQDAVEAIFRGCTHQLFASTVDGLHTRLQAGGVGSPFYEVLMDTYNTMIRASRAGEGLVKAGYYDYRGTSSSEGVVLRHAMQVDEAMLSGNEDRFMAAKERFVKAFPGASIQ